MSYINCIPEDLSEYESNDCYYPKGGISKFGVLKTGHNIADFSNATQVQAAITAGTLRIMGPLRGDIPEPSPIEGENVTACGSETILDGFDNTANIIDFNVNQANDAFYNKLNASQFPGVIFFLCQQDAIRVVEKTVSFVARYVSDPSNKVKDRYLITAKWSTGPDDSIPLLYDAPAGIF